MQPMPNKKEIFSAEWDNIVTRYYDDGTAEYHGDDGRCFTFVWVVLNGVVQWRPDDCGDDKAAWHQDAEESQEAYDRYLSRLVTEETADA